MEHSIPVFIRVSNSWLDCQYIKNESI
jgi:hypothetical protein